ncbi:acetyl-CoA carboxylase biotin carboxylase subunit family protein [Streptomyces sp. EN23]|uniref:ATP-grasp domain-containing protein n=1 Tax=Streptomyces sp. EN23 TaxID=212774 RepID=UPI000851BC53|nr:ATP-grasp domain-containing protein [Streptomyces sp. EN23]
MHIVIVNRWPRFTDGVRWDHELTRYEEFVDHTGHQVSYVVDPAGATGVRAAREQIAAQVVVADISSFDEVSAAVATVVDEVGRPVDRILTLSEFTLDTVARVRQAHGIPGPTPEDVAVYRNKVRMKELLAAAGLRTPRFAPCEDVEQTVSFARSCGYPVIVKPVDGAGSIGVHRVADEEELRALWAGQSLHGSEIEEFISGTVHHVDGFADADGKVVFQVVSRYLNDCLSFQNGTPLGSVVMQSSALRDRIEDFARDCVGALDMRGMPFHLELFVTPAQELVFLEVAGRVGGSEVPYVIHKLFGVNLFELWLRHLSGDPLPAVAPKDGDPSGGWLIMPKPQHLPAEVVTSSSMRASVNSVWRELVPAQGQVLEASGGYDSLQSGRFIVVHDSESGAEADMRRLMADFRIELAGHPQSAPAQ